MRTRHDSAATAPATMDRMVQPLRPPQPPSPVFQRLGLVALAMLLLVTIAIGGNYERLGVGTEIPTTTIPALSAPLRPLHNPDPVVISPLHP